MAEGTKTLITQEGLEKIEAEIRAREERMAVIAESLKAAKDHGDISENAEYDAARDEQAENQARLNELYAIKGSSEVYKEESNSKRVGFGTTVTVKDIETGEELTYTIKGPAEANSLKGSISNESPLGKALIGAKKGQTVSVDCPAGILKYKVLDFGRDKKEDK